MRQHPHQAHSRCPLNASPRRTVQQGAEYGQSHCHTAWSLPGSTYHSPSRCDVGLMGCRGTSSSAEHESQYRRVVGPVQERIPSQSVGLERGEVDQVTVSQLKKTFGTQLKIPPAELLQSKRSLADAPTSLHRFPRPPPQVCRSASAPAF